MGQFTREVTKADVHVKNRSKSITPDKTVDPEANKLKESNCGQYPSINS